MTARERAEQILDSEDTQGACRKGRLIYAIEQAINAAVEEERKACAQLADDMSGIKSIGGDIGEAIRERNNGGTK